MFLISFFFRKYFSINPTFVSVFTTKNLSYVEHLASRVEGSSSVQMLSPKFFMK